MKQPNIILINCDDLGYGDLESYGSTRNNTPHLNRLASEGMRFTNFYSSSALCSPSRAAMMTGCMPPRISFGNLEGRGVLFPGDPVGLSPDEMTLPRMLKNAGYATKLVGKWHCGDQHEFLPTRHGFDSYFGIPYSNDMGRQGKLRSGYPPLPLMRDEEVWQQQPDQRGLTERYVDESLRFMDENHDKPFFLYLAHMYVHVPLFVPQVFMENSRNGAYGGAVECIDWALGALMHKLKQLSLDENTLMIFTSDNGSRARDEGGSNAPLRGHKAQTWEGGQRVPCIMRWPGEIPAGLTCDAITRQIDLFPTICSLLGLANPQAETHPIDGVDISSLMKDPAAPPPNDMFVYYMGHHLCAVRKGDWKLHFAQGDFGMSSNEFTALYNLKDDVGEEHNVHDEHPEVVAELTQLAHEIREDIGDERLGITGANRRPIGRVDNPKPLCDYDESHPYIVALYDRPDMKTMGG